MFRQSGVIHHCFYASGCAHSTPSHLTIQVASPTTSPVPCFPLHQASAFERSSPCFQQGLKAYFDRRDHQSALCSVKRRPKSQIHCAATPYRRSRDISWQSSKGVKCSSRSDLTLQWPARRVGHEACTSLSEPKTYT
jgi:hypothetical protein